jgi:hypothetical protein
LGPLETFLSEVYEIAVYDVGDGIETSELGEDIE